jgi:hypothetical protein
MHLTIDMRRLFASATSGSCRGSQSCRVFCGSPNIIRNGRFLRDSYAHTAQQMTRAWRTTTNGGVDDAQPADPRLLELVDPLRKLSPQLAFSTRVSIRRSPIPASPAACDGEDRALIITGGETDVCVMATVAPPSISAFASFCRLTRFARRTVVTCLITVYRDVSIFSETVTTEQVLEEWKWRNSREIAAVVRPSDAAQARAPDQPRIRRECGFPLQLLEGALPRRLVGTPAHQARAVPEAAAAHLIVCTSTTSLGSTTPTGCPLVDQRLGPRARRR